MTRIVRAVTVMVIVLGGIAASSSAPPAGAQDEDGKPPRPIRWLAAGDSYSSGEGLPNVAEPTCQRADGSNESGSKAYAVVAEEVLNWPLEEPDGKRGFDFVACTGAVTQDLFDDANGKKQWDPSNNGRFDLVTFSFGGNDVQFAATLFRCLGFSVEGALAAASGVALPGSPGPLKSWTSGAGCPPEGEIRDRIDAMARGEVRIGDRALPAYEDFLRRVASDVATPGNNVVVIGYPALIEDPQFWPLVNQATGLCQGIRKRDALMLRGVAGYLNQTIGAAVEDVNAEAINDVRFTFVDINTANGDVDPNNEHLYEPSSRDRHNLCAAEPWLNGITTGVFGGDFRYLRSFHPTQEGHNAVGALITSHLKTLTWDRHCDSVSGDMSSPGERAEVVEGLCIGSWALVDECVDCLGDTWVIAEYSSGRWGRRLSLPDFDVCEADARDMGIPDPIIDRLVWTDCTTAPPSSPSTAPVDCGVTLPQFGGGVRTFAIGVSCDRAAAILLEYYGDPAQGDYGAPKQGSSGHAEVQGFACWADALPEPSPGDVTGGCSGPEGDIELRMP